MRKGLVFLMAATLVLGMTATASALPFDSIGWVEPNYNNSWDPLDPSDLTGTARYFFYWDNPNVLVTELDLQFEGDIFNLSLLDATDFSVIAPPGWTTSMYVENSNLQWSLTYGGGIDYTQDPIIIDVAYALLSKSRYYYGNNTYAGDSVIWAWNEAQGANSPWVQKYLLSGTGNPGGSYSSGGSTAPVPEPTSLLLLGSGLLGLALFGTIRRRVN